MSEQGHGMIDEESSRRYQAHKEKVKAEIAAERSLNQAQGVDISGRWKDLHGIDHGMSTEKNKQKIEVAQANLNLEQQATEAQIEQTRKWKDENLEALVDSANSDEHATETEK